MTSENENATVPADPFYGRCQDCDGFVLAVYVRGHLVLASPHEHEPRASCPICGHVAGRGHKRGQCWRCDQSGFIGEDRPRDYVLAIDVAWSDTGGVRVIGPNTPRRRGEGLSLLHQCGGVVRVPILRRSLGLCGFRPSPYVLHV